LPVIDGLDCGNEGCTGDKAFFDQRAGQSRCFAGAGASGKNDADWRCVGHHRGFIHLRSISDGPKLLIAPNMRVVGFALDL
jgi:hypothetical protein